MGLPKVTINLLNGQLGAVESYNDGIAGLVLSGTAINDKIGLNDPKVLTNIKDLDALGITEANNPLAYKEIKAFFSKAGIGAELWVTLFSKDTNLVDLCDKTKNDNVIKNLLDAAGGRIRLLGINRLPDISYTPITTNGIDQDVINAIINLQDLAKEYADNYKPFRALLPGLFWTGTLNNLVNLTQNTANRVSVVLASDDPINKTAAIGLTLGRLASIPVYRNIGRVKDGAIISEAYFTDGSKANSKEGYWSTLHELGYIFLRSFQGKNGYYFNYDHTCSPMSDDYHQISLGRVIDKAIVLIYTTYIEELLDNVKIDESGKLHPAICSYFENKIENAINTTMSEEISNFSAYINPEQNVLSSGKLLITCNIVPLGTLKEIVVELGFNNPVLTS